MAETTPTKAGPGSGCLSLFAVPFAAVSVGMLGLLLWTCFDWLAVQRWEEVPATIVRTELKAHSDSDGGTTYQATAEYRYRYRGRDCTGTRVSLHRGADNVGSFQKNVYRELKQHQRSGRPFRCYVNPSEPTEAILYRDLRWEMIGFYGLFVAVFGAFGFGMIGYGIYASRQTRRQKAQATEHPDEPWLWRDDWAKGEIKTSGQLLWMAIACFALIWNAISLPALFAIPGVEAAKNNPLSLLVLLFPAVGLVLLLAAGYLFLRWRKYGNSVFQMAAVPGVIGGKLAGVIRTSACVRPERGYQVTLNCVHCYTSGSGKNSSNHQTVLWQDEQTIARGLAEADPSQTAIPVLFAIPYDARPSDSQSSDDQLVWRLEVTADVPGIDYKASFEVPVFRTAESRPDFHLDESALAPYAAPVDPQRELAKAGAIKTVAPDGSARYVFPRGRPWRAALGMTAFTAIWTGVIALLLHFEAPILFPIVFGLFDALMILVLLDVWCYRSVVDVSPRGLVIAAGLTGLGQPRSIEASQIAAIDFRQSMQVGTQAYGNLVIRVRGQKPVTAAKWLPSRRCAETMIRQWEETLTDPAGSTVGK